MSESFHSLLLSFLILLAWGLPLVAEEKGTPNEVAETFDPPFFLIRPGTPIVDAPPPSWSHFVVKAQSKLVSGDVDSVPTWGARMAARIRTVILADVGHPPEDPHKFALRKIGIGLCLADQKGSDIVVSANQAEELGFELGTLEKVVLESAEAELARGRMTVATPTFGIYRSPTTMLNQGEHRASEILYAFLVDPNSGDLRVVVWSREIAANRKNSIKNLVELRPNLVYECGIDVKARRLLGTIPISWSFAMQDILPGRKRTVSPELAEKMEAIASGRPDPRILEKALIEYLSTRTTIRGTSSNDSPPVPDAASESGPERPARTSTAKSARLETNSEVR